MIKMLPKLIFDLGTLLLSLFSTEVVSAAPPCMTTCLQLKLPPGDGSLCRNLRSLDRAFDATVRTSSRCRAPSCVLRLRPFVSPTWPAALAFSRQPAYSGTTGRW